MRNTTSMDFDSYLMFQTFPTLGTGHVTKKDDLWEKFQNSYCRFWNFKQGWVFDHEIDAKGSFQSSGCVFSTIVLRKSNKDKH